jgi:aryl-alcohol dehydrogenase-like predicted oxidoreductase
MKYRELGRTGYQVSTISFGAWAIGGSWGSVDDKESYAALNRAVDLGVNFFDTADVYGDGRSEKLLAKLRQNRSEEIIIATKAGRRLSPHVAEGYNKKNLTKFVERSLRNLKTDALDLLQLHCPPTTVYYMPEVFDALDELTQKGKLRFYGVSVERVEEALKAIEYPNVQSVQIIFNLFRQRPADLFFREAQHKQVGVLARLPLSSGMLSGKITKATKFEKDDHRKFNRQGEAFDKGETFSGFDFNSQLAAVERVRALVPAETSMAQFALQWILMFKAVTCAIPGARRISQVEENVAAADLKPLSQVTMSQTKALYDKWVKQYVHQSW